MAAGAPARKGSWGLVFGANTGQAGASFCPAKGPRAAFSTEQLLGATGPPHRGARGSGAQPLPTALTSALYMRMRPWLTLDQEGTALMFQSWLECSAKGPVFI